MRQRGGGEGLLTLWHLSRGPFRRARGGSRGPPASCGPLLRPGAPPGSGSAGPSEVNGARALCSGQELATRRSFLSIVLRPVASLAPHPQGRARDRRRRRQGRRESSRSAARPVHGRGPGPPCRIARPLPARSRPRLRTVAAPSVAVSGLVQQPQRSRQALRATVGQLPGGSSSSWAHLHHRRAVRGPAVQAPLVDDLTYRTRGDSLAAPRPAHRPPSCVSSFGEPVTGACDGHGWAKPPLPSGRGSEGPNRWWSWRCCEASSMATAAGALSPRAGEDVPAPSPHPRVTGRTASAKERAAMHEEERYRHSEAVAATI